MTPIKVISFSLTFCVLQLAYSGDIATAEIPSNPLAVGIAHVCTQRTNNAVLCWGNNKYGQLGNGTTSSSARAVTVRNLTDVLAIATGVGYSCAIVKGGEVMCWGAGLDAVPHTGKPKKVAGISGAKEIAASWGHTCVVLSDGTLKCWGLNNEGQLGDGSKTTSPIPVKAKGVLSAVKVAAGIAHSCAIILGGTVKCWGTDGFGLGQSIAVGSPNPTIVEGISSAVALSTGRNFSCAVLDDGGIKCWGSNVLGQLGNPNAQILSALAVTVSGISTAKSISAGLFHACALLIPISFLLMNI